MVYFLCKAYDSDRQNCYFALSLPVRGAWVEMEIRADSSPVILSLPVRGAWVEIMYAAIEPFVPRGRSPCGERGLKLSSLRLASLALCRSPCGERGLK